MQGFNGTLDDAISYAEHYVGPERVKKALSETDDLQSVWELIRLANRIKDWRVDEIARGVYKALERAFKKKR